MRVNDRGPFVGGRIIDLSQEAARRFAMQRAEGSRKRRDADLLDAEAAAVILERWLAAPQDASAVP